MIYSVNELRKETVSLIKQIEMQIGEVEKAANARNIDPLVMRDSDGNWPMVPLLMAKATAYNTLVMLQSNERQSRR